MIIKFLLYKIILTLSPLHSEMIYYISSTIIKIKLEKNSIVDYIIFGLCIISSLIYLEILILNFCQFNKNIKENIILRGEKEIIQELASQSKRMDTLLDSSINL